MVTELLFSSEEYHSTETCRFISGAMSDPGRYEVNSRITGTYEDQKFRVGYTLQIDQAWRTTMVAVDCRYGIISNRVILQSDGEGNWIHESIHTSTFKNCFDVDLSLTPFTNTLPVRRLEFEKDQTHEINVLYFDLLTFEIYPVKQRYTRVTEHTYRFETVPKDFEAAVHFDDEGFVVNYPGLFKRLRKTFTT